MGPLLSLFAKGMKTPRTGPVYNQRIARKSPSLSLNDDQVRNLTMFEIEKILLRNSSSGPA
ncbi:hypothetical protein OSB04_016748 [Centaurea solstitialis]|uniref:Uncharacterized protein n=1 Tax=Centaurea solstitialis TaxID=347529 RepID=A0AA38T1K3_9ASTR|nr:hypothetical protein OSB04_016748 [Centaurea solstitialis]